MGQVGLIWRSKYDLQIGKGGSRTTPTLTYYTWKSAYFLHYNRWSEYLIPSTQRFGSRGLGCATKLTRQPRATQINPIHDE